uniref:DUF4352 domain-containing protein n=1 Tax=Ignisphaera aggregans TaxID=334771 RepID=A0A7C2ZV02_9CREN
MKLHTKSVRKGDLSAPVLAVIVTIGVIAAGLTIMAWFWWFAPQAGRMGALVITGASFVCNKLDDNGNGCVNGTIIVSMKNIGNQDVTVSGIITPYFTANLGSQNITIAPGATATVSNTVTCDPHIPASALSVEGTLVSDAGNYRFTASIVWPAG